MAKPAHLRNISPSKSKKSEQQPGRRKRRKPGQTGLNRAMAAQAVSRMLNRGFSR